MPMINNSVSIIQKWLNSGGDLSQLLKNYNGESIQEIIEEINKKADAKTVKGGFNGGDGAVAAAGGAVGGNAQAGFGGAVGRSAYTDVGGAIGLNAKAGAGGAIGWNAKAGIGFSGGSNAIVEKDSEGNYIDAIQLGMGINYDPKTLQVYEYTMMNEDGSIPEERLTKAKDYTNNKIAEFVNGAPETLNTLSELADALGDDPNFAKTVATNIGKKADAKTENGGFQGGENANAKERGGSMGASSISKNGGAIGYTAQTTEGGAIGRNTRSHNGGAVGWEARTGDGFSGGYMAQTEYKDGTYIDAIQLGRGTNSKSKTLQVYDYTMMNADGTIPEERLPILKTLATTEYVDSKMGSGGGEGDSILGFDYYYEFEDYDTYYIELDKFKSSGLYKIKIKERTEVLLVSTLGSWGETVQLRISMEGYPTIERRAGRYYESDYTWFWEDWDACAMIGYVDERIDYVDGKIGNIDTLLDSVLAIEQELIGETLVDTSIAVCDSYINGGNAE